jgi:carbon monoxide dehydrogenase subunit G
LKQWTKEIEINASIETVWGLFKNPKSMQKIMPQVIENKPVKITEDKVGSVYRQKYQEGKRTQEYDVETLEYLDEPERKRLKIGFTLANMFEITAFYELKKLDDQRTLFTYTATNKALKWFVKLFLVFANDKIMIDFVERVKRVAETEK